MTTPSSTRLSRFLSWGRPFLVFGGVCLVIWSILRIALGLSFGSRSGVTATDLLRALGVGTFADAVVLLYVLVPLALLGALMPSRVRRSRLFRWAVLAAGWAFLFGLLYLSAVEYFFFEEFDSRFNLVAVDYLIYPHEVLINIWDSYPVLPVLAAVFVASALLMKLLSPELARPPRGSGWRARSAKVGTCLALAAAAWLAPAPRTLAHFDNRAAGELAANGVASFFEALDTNEIDYHTYYATGDPEDLFRVLTRHLETSDARFTRLAQHRLDRRFNAHADLASPADGRPPNVVVVVEESLGAEFLGAYGATSGLSPEFDALAERGKLFTHAYATGTRTVRGLEAVVASFPPIPSVSIVRRPGNEGIATWGKVMRERGYHASFLYGGFSYFDNMSYFFSNNGFAVSDRTDIEDPAFANIWGVSDEDLFRHALAYFDGLAESGGPFFSVVLSTSNHKPFTFPPGVPGVPEEGGGRPAGVRYADYALGRFFEEAQEHEWFENTLFVVVGDHGARVYGSAEIPVESYEIPILFYAPALLAPSRVDTPMSQIDIAPTILGLLGRPYEAPFFGQDVLLSREDDSRALLLSHNHDVAVLRGPDLVVLGLHKEVRGLVYDRDRHALTPSPPDPGLTELAMAYYQTAYEQFEGGTYR